ncbi:MAG: YwiC-like family protein [Chloroflexi bacterium]|nr:YwiC-like family protein [Chloroflexota bacterium]
MKTTLFRRHIALPQDHGSWVFILSPLFIGIFAGRQFTSASIFLITAVMAAFLLRQPVTIAVKAYAGRRPRSDLPAARFWMLVYGAISLLMVAGLVARGFTYVLYLAVPGTFVFVWHLYLVSKRAERRQAGLEIVASGVLALAAPAALWVGKETYDPMGWALWILVWLQSAASIVHAYMRLNQRDLAQVPARREKLRLGSRALLYTTFNLAATLVASAIGWLPRLIFLPFLLQWSETIWGISHPAIRAKPTAIGVRQLIVSTLFTILFIVTWKV